MVFISITSYSQDDARLLLQNLAEEELENIDALAVYPMDTRRAILQACLHPEVLIKIIAKSPDRINVFREFGKIEQARENYNRKYSIETNTESVY